MNFRYGGLVLRNMRLTLIRSVLAACCLAASLSGCSAGPLGDALPQSLGGLPADTPPPPKVPYQYPAVHDMPPPRTSEPLSDEQQWKLERDLNALRNRQERLEADDKTPAAPAKAKATKGKGKKVKKKTAAQNGETSGVKTSP
jgi:hypothetical protein